MPQVGDSKAFRRVVVVSGDLTGPDLAGIVSKSASETEEHWFLVGNRGIGGQVVASLLAALELDRQRQILRPGFMPWKPGAAFLFSDGSWRQGRNRSFPPWVVQEIQRLAACLTSNHTGYVEKIVRALSGRPRDVLGGFPPGFVLEDPYLTAGLTDSPPELAADLSKGPEVALGWTWDQAAQIHYQRDRYMAHLSREDLARRIVDILGNLNVADEIGVARFDPGGREDPYWRLLFAEIIGEMAARYGPYPAGWKDLLQDPEWPGSFNAERDPARLTKWDIRTTRPLAAGTLVKYGEERYLRRALRLGKVRISPASSYADRSLDPSRRDEELKLTLDVNPFGAGGYGGLPSILARQASLRKQVSVSSGTDYFVYCTSRVLSRRLFPRLRPRRLLPRDP